MSGQFPAAVLFDHIPDTIHPLDHKHLHISEFIFLIICIFSQEGIVSVINRIDPIQKTGKMIVDAAPPHECIAVGICFDLRAVYKQRF